TGTRSTPPTAKSGSVASSACPFDMPVSPEERESLKRKFVEYRQTHDRRLRNELIEAHRSLAMHLARRFANRGEPFDDLLQVAYLGMLKAVERFDPDRQLEFSTFATAT